MDSEPGWACLETPRLILRPWSPADAVRFVEIFATFQVTEFPWGRPLMASESLTMLANWMAHWEREGFGLWAAVDRETGETAGTIGLAVPTFLPEVLPAVEVGWRLHPAWWGRGLATEGAAASLDFAFDELGLERVVSIPQQGNPRSWRVAERLGMNVERRAVLPQRNVSVVVYQITADEWKAVRDQIC